jgi:hypothetical protein
VRDRIEQFMWGFQPHFRMRVERDVQRVLEYIGVRARAEVVLVGFLVPGGDRHQICIEPEDGPFTPAHFEEVAARAEALFRADPESEVWHSDRRHHELRQRSLRDLARARAIQEALEREAAERRVTFFVGSSTVVEQHEVHIAIGLPANAVESAPALTTEVRDRFPVVRSLLHAVLGETLRLGARSLRDPDAGSALYVLGVETADIVRAAASRMVTSVVALASDPTGGDLYSALNEVSTLRYEQRVGVGSVILARPGHANVVETIRLRGSVPLTEHRTVRKLLEISGREGLSLLTDGSDVYALGAGRGDYNPDDETLFSITVVGQGAWELRHADHALLGVEFGSPRLPRARIDRHRFSDTVERVFAGIPNREPALLWELALAAASAEHGTMLVVSTDAEPEAARLSAQALPVEAARLDPTTLAQVSSIDGAILLSPDGKCHAMGVILDGVATDRGDRSRGARLNSAIRYLASTPIPTVIVLVSEDGMINVLPDLRPRIARANVEMAIEAIRAIAGKKEFDPERFYKAFDRVEELEFYLDADQCEEANALRERMEERRWEAHQMRIGHRALRPDPEMHDSYFLD